VHTYIFEGNNSSKTYGYKVQHQTLGPSRLLLHRTLGLVGQKSRSSAHQSRQSRPKNPKATPIFLLGFARSGTTTFQRILAESLDYNFAFEPFGFNHANYPPKEFQSISAFFRNAPDLSSMDRYFIDGGAAAAVDMIRSESTRGEYTALLGDYINWLIEHYGRNVVIKEVRLLFNLPALISIFKKAEMPVLFVLLRFDPVNTLYTFYRLGGLVEGRDDFGHRVDEFYSYHQQISALNQSFEFPVCRCSNKWEKLLVSIKHYQNVMEYFSSRFSANCVLVNFETASEGIALISKRLGYPARSDKGKVTLKPARYKMDSVFMDTAHERISKEVLVATGVSLPTERQTPVSTKQRFQFRITQLQNKLLEL